MGNLFTWFYCLDIPVVLLLMALAAYVFFRLREEYGRRRWWPWCLLGLLLLWLLLVLHMTLSRSGGTVREPILTPFQSYISVWNGGNRELLRSCFMNAVLFFPAGFLLAALFSRMRPLPRRLLSVLSVLLLCLFSAAIEYGQWRFALGQAEADDVIHNCLGALAGLLTVTIYDRYKKGACS